MGFLRKAMTWLFMIALAIVASSYLLPRTIEVSRMTEIKAKPETVFAHINSMQAFSEWSPWSDKDPDMQVTFSGPEAGVGNTMAWVSTDPDVGTGSQTITAIVENEKVATALDFGEMGSGLADFLISEKEGGTAVEWHFKTDLGMNPISRWMGLMISEGVGADYERGLDLLKASAEAL